MIYGSIASLHVTSFTFHKTEVTDFTYEYYIYFSVNLKPDALWK